MCVCLCACVYIYLGLSKHIISTVTVCHRRVYACHSCTGVSSECMDQS